jgi:hypothetical protein
MSGTSEKRQALRIPPFVAPCRYVVGDQRVAGFLTDLSSRGGRIHTEIEPPSVDARVTVEVRFGGQPTHVQLPAAVEWARTSARGGFVFGVSFAGIGADEQRAVDGVVEEFRRRAAAIE